jgi:hypothetical protein
MLSIEEIIKSHKNVCWYPSAGIDIPAAYFINQHESIPDVDLFIFTDPIYRNFERDKLKIDFCFDNEQFQGSKYYDYLYKSIGIKRIECESFVPVKNFEDNLFIPEPINENINTHIKDIISKVSKVPIYLSEYNVIDSHSNVKKIKILLIGCFNEPFYVNFFKKEKIKLNFLIFKLPKYRYGGLNQSNLWILNSIISQKVEYLATEIVNEPWKKEDEDLNNIYHGDLGGKVNPPKYLKEYKSILIKMQNREIYAETLFYREYLDLGNAHNENENSKYFGLNRIKD